jgi:hypothetical protein
VVEAGERCGKVRGEAARTTQPLILNNKKKKWGKDGGAEGGKV